MCAHEQSEYFLTRYPPIPFSSNSRPKPFTFWFWKFSSSSHTCPSFASPCKDLENMILRRLLGSLLLTSVRCGRHDFAPHCCPCPLSSPLCCDACFSIPEGCHFPPFVHRFLSSISGVSQSPFPMTSWRQPISWGPLIWKILIFFFKAVFSDTGQSSPRLKRLKQEGLKFKACLGYYGLGSRLVWAISRNKKLNKETNKKPV